MATELLSQREQVAEPELPVCDACLEYDCKLKLPGEFAGTYIRSGVEEENGALCILHFGDPTKDARKCARAVEDKIGNKDFDFRRVTFSCSVQFNSEMENAHFGEAKFSGAADFHWAEFSGAANFRGATFSGWAFFQGVKFSGAADFRGATFSDTARFHLARFNGAADFQYTTFSGAADFQFARFRESVRFDRLLKSSEEEINPTDRWRVRLDFRLVTLEKPDKVHFREVDMGEVSFRLTDVRKVEFTNVQWPERLRDEREAEQGGKWFSLARLRNWRGLREAEQGGKWFSLAELRNWRGLREAWRETTKNRKGQLAIVEKLCHQLRLNYEDQRNYPDAGRFYYREMEMRRKASLWRRYLPSLTTLYWLSSGYGQRPWRAFVWTVALLLSFSLLYMATGLKIEGAVNPGFPATVNWPDLSATWMSFREWARNFGYAALHTSQVLTFSRIRTFTPLDWQGELLIVLQTVILPLQVALLALAVRRSFQR